MRLPTVRDNNAEELRAFDDVCQRLGGFDEQIVFEWVDGYLTGLAAGPRLPADEDWLAASCGDAFDRAFADPPARTAALRALKTRLAVLREQLDPEALFDTPDALRLNPLMSEWDDASRAAAMAEGDISAEDAANLQTGALWALGVMDCAHAWPELWPAPDVDAEPETAAYYGELWSQVEALAWPADAPELAAHLATMFPDATPDRDDLVTQACFAVQDLRLFWVDHAPRPATRRVEAAPGRNDPCPCGSGKKYKKCHGASGA